MTPSRNDAGESVAEALGAEESEAVSEAVEAALSSAESERTEYWIRTLGQRIVVAAEEDTG